MIVIVEIQGMNTFEESYILIVVATLAAAAWWEDFHVFQKVRCMTACKIASFSFWLLFT